MLMSDFFVDIVAFFCNFCILIEVRLFLVSKFSRYSSQLLFLSQDGDKNEKKYHKSNFSRKGISKDTCWLWLWSVLLRKSSKYWASKLFFLSLLSEGQILLRKSSKYWASKRLFWYSLHCFAHLIKKKLKILSIETFFLFIISYTNLY